MKYHPMGSDPIPRARGPQPHAPRSGARAKRSRVLPALGMLTLAAFLTTAATQAFAAKDDLLAQIKERGALRVCEAAYPPYNEYQAKTPRKIPVFFAEPV